MHAEPESVLGKARVVGDVGADRDFSAGPLGRRDGCDLDLRRRRVGKGRVHEEEEEAEPEEEVEEHRADPLAPLPMTDVDFGGLEDEPDKTDADGESQKDEDGETQVGVAPRDEAEAGDEDAEHEEHRRRAEGDEFLPDVLLLVEGCHLKGRVLLDALDDFLLLGHGRAGPREGSFKGFPRTRERLNR